MITKETIKQINLLNDQGYNKSQIAEKLNISRPTVIKYLNRTNSYSRETSEDNIRNSVSSSTNKRKIKNNIKSKNIKVGHNPTYRRIQREHNTRIDQQEYKQSMIDYYSDLAINQLKNAIPDEFKNLFNVRHSLELKDLVKKSINSLIDREHPKTIEEYVGLIAKEYYDENFLEEIENIQNEKKKAELVKVGINKVSWKVISINFDKEIDIGYEERKKIEEFVRKRLEKNLTGIESDNELDKLVEFLVNKWIEIYM